MENSPKKEKRSELIKLSIEAKEIKKANIANAVSLNESLYWASRTVNFMLMKLFYNPDNSLVFKKFNEWKAEGKTIIKGSKSIAVWAQPLAKLKKDNAEETTEDEMQYFPMCYLFSNLQVK